MLVVFFFQAEDGIRDHCVTGVQTCALPIWPWNHHHFLISFNISGARATNQLVVEATQRLNLLMIESLHYKFPKRKDCVIRMNIPVGHSLDLNLRLKIFLICVASNDWTVVWKFYDHVHLANVGNWGLSATCWDTGKVCWTSSGLQ